MGHGIFCLRSAAGNAAPVLAHISGSSGSLQNRTITAKIGSRGEVFPVHVQRRSSQKKSDEDFTSGATPGSRPGCIFLRRNPAGPGRSAQFMQRGPCFAGNSGATTWSSAIPSGEPAGRMVGRADIQTSDPVLARIWNDGVKSLPCPASPEDDPAWVQRVYAILAKHGTGGGGGRRE